MTATTNKRKKKKEKKLFVFFVCKKEKKKKHLFSTWDGFFVFLIPSSVWFMFACVHKLNSLNLSVNSVVSKSVARKIE